MASTLHSQPIRSLGAICFGILSDDKKGELGYSLAVGAGIATGANAVFNCFIICSHPQFQEMSQRAEAGFDRPGAWHCNEALAAAAAQHIRPAPSQLATTPTR